jgi:SAM-dependent methyltransferase
MKAVVCATGRVLEKPLSGPEILEILGKTRQTQIPGHPEAKWLQPYCTGLSIDLGCGAEKVLPGVLGIDKLAVGEAGKTGCMLGIGSIADISADAGDLYFLSDGTFDSAVSRHCFEHLPDTVVTLREWLRILKKGGTLALVLPHDGDGRDFMLIDSDHKFRCYPETVERALTELNGRGWPVKGELVENGKAVVPNWSFFSLIRRT